jgi:hypothetical protein
MDAPDQTSGGSRETPARPKTGASTNSATPANNGRAADAVPALRARNICAVGWGDIYRAGSGKINPQLGMAGN